ncbi:MAG: metallophosphoesterase, partial [Prevotella sp.]|nr:metallophosphoesterase [Prevotella sp.]
MNTTRLLLSLTVCLLMATACTKEDTAETQEWSGAGYPDPEKEENAKRIMLATDIHVMAKELLLSSGEAYDNYIKTDPKLLEYSEEVLQTLVDKALETRPDLVIFPGDLTKDGELLSHQKVANLLAPLYDEGIPVVVVPGNHDIENPNGRYFDGSETSPAERTSPETFTSIYHNYGYGSAIERDETSLSYVTEPIEGLVLLCIDTNRYDENLYKEKGDERDMNQTAGRIRQSTLEWLCEQSDKAREKGKQVVVVQHHNMVPHHDAEPTIQSDYLIEDHKEVAEKLTAHGIHLALTGHLHLHDVAQLRMRHDGRIDSLVDIATSSAVSYPNAYRMITASNNFTKWRVETEYVTSTASIDDI